MTGVSDNPIRRALRRLFPWRFPADPDPTGSASRFVSPTFLKRYYPRLGIRRDTFLALFRLLEEAGRETYTFVETGTSRSLKTNLSGDGGSTFLFDAFLRCYEGTLTSIDVDAKACRQVQSAVSARTRVICGDSLAQLPLLPGPFDFVYLDSMDIDFLNPRESAEHHLREFRIVDDRLRPGGLLMIDDTPASAEHRPPWIAHELPWPNGKGYLIDEAIRAAGTYRKVLHRYQCLYQKACPPG